MILALLQTEALFDEAIFQALVKFIGHAIETGNYIPLILTLVAVVGAVIFRVVGKKTGVPLPVIPPKTPDVIQLPYVPVNPTPDAPKEGAEEAKQKGG